MPSDKPIIWAAAAAVVVGGAVFYYYYHTASTETPAAAAVHPAVLPPAEPEPAIKHPVPAANTVAAAPLPTLADSDAAIHSALTGVSGAAALEKFLVPQNIVRHIVVTVDNLPRKKVALELRPLKPTPGHLVTAGTADEMTLSAQNAARYAPFVDLVRSTPTRDLVAQYYHFYPLFQQAYENLGYPTQYFNDRVIEVIDDLLMTPDVKGPIGLTQPNVMYQYADPRLEALSAGQKTLLRMGPENEAALKVKLHELRDALAARKP